MSKSSETSIYKDYFQYTKTYREQYGPKTIVLMMVGAFFEVYGRKGSDGSIVDSDIENFAEVCQLAISEKKDSHMNSKIVMAGFRDFTIDKYLDKLTDAGYTVPVFIQEKVGKEIHRKLSDIYSPGTYVPYDADSSPRTTNYVMCVWITIHKPRASKAVTQMRDIIVYGVSVVNIFTGKTSMFQHETAFYMNMSSFDELERYVSIFSPSEVIFISPLDEKDSNSVMQMSGLRPQTVHRIRTDQNAAVDRCTSQKYIREMLSHFFGDESFDICTEFQTNIIATQSFCYLLNFIQEHNPDLVRKISMPEFNNASYRMILANHTLAQLNIIGNGETGKYSSVLACLNSCSSSMGKRRFQYQLLNPTYDSSWLLQEYSITALLLADHTHFIDLFRKKLTQIRDLEKIARQLVIKKIYPASIFQLHQSIQHIQQINLCLVEVPQLCDYLCNELQIPLKTSANEYIDEICRSITKYIDERLCIDMCKQVNSMTSFDVNIIRPGISPELDHAAEKYAESENLFHMIHDGLNRLIQARENSGGVEYIKIHETEKSGVSLQITAKRSLLLKSIATSTPNANIVLDNGVSLDFKELKFSKASASNVEIDLPQLKTICQNMLTWKETLQSRIAETYRKILGELEVYIYDDIERIAQYVSKVDVLQNKAYIAQKYNYCCPTLIEDSSTSFVDARELRHCLIEHIQLNELYVTNDVSMGQNGILLYGTNAVGKTSLIRALGISIILAQAGMFVPCSQFRYKPYTAIFSRILGNDNLFKGLSTFAVEMTELRMILKMADENSLVLGDELCSGTENESALSIFVAGLMNLHEKRSSFIFATHFHEITEYEEIQSMERISLKYMAVTYDREQDRLIYDRKLKDGSGPKTYGLEVCKSLYMDTEFLDLAFQIRNKYFPETSGILSNPATRYNSNKIRGLCEQCGQTMGEEIHHVAQQKDADEKGFIGTFHKNHKANLMSLCEECHDKIHKDTGSQKIRKKTSKGYAYLDA